MESLSGRLSCRVSCRLVFASSLVVCLAACAPLNQPRAVAPMQDIPQDWAAGVGDASARASSLARWWNRFDDPMMVSLIEQALQSNTSIQSARAALRQARALRDVSAASLSPQLDGSGSAQRSKSGGNAATNRFGLGLDASWEIDVFGGNRSGLDGSEAEVRTSSAELDGARVSIAAEVALTYIGLRSSQARLAIALANLAAQADTLQITEWRLQAGLVSGLVAEQARAGVEQTRAQLPALYTDIGQASHALAVLTGQPPAALISMLESAAPVPRADDFLALLMPAETLRQRPDVRAAEFRVVAAMARVSQAQAARRPSFRLSGSLGLNALTLGALGGSGALVTSLLAGVAVPLLDGGAGRARVEAQDGALDQSRAAYRATVLTALQEVEDALLALRGDRERLAALRRAAQAAAEAATLARQLFESGLTDFQTVLDTQRTRLNTEDAVATTNAEISADHVRLYKALGGGWEAS